MITLTPTLEAAQKAATRDPCVRVMVRPQIANVPRLDWNRIYAGGEADYYHAATCPGDGSLVRVRLEDAGGYARVLVNRVTNPQQGADFGNWVTVDPTNATVPGDVALAASPNRPEEIYLVYFNASRSHLIGRTSTDGGQTWSAWYNIGAVASGNPGHCAVLSTEGLDTEAGYRLFLYSEGGNVLNAVFYSCALKGWFGPYACPHSFNSITGLATFWAGDDDSFPVLLTGTDTLGNPKVWTTQYTPEGDDWSDLNELTAASADAGVGYAAPFAGKPDVFRLTFDEAYSGDPSYHRPFWSHAIGSSPFNTACWREPVPFNYPPNAYAPVSAPYGLVLAYTAGKAYLTTPWAVWQADLEPPADLDVSPDIVALEMFEGKDGGQARVHLANLVGKYNAPGFGSLSNLSGGAQVQISLGYHTAAGEEVADGPTFWVDRFEWEVSGAEARLIVRCLDGWEVLDRWVARRQFVWPAGIFTIWQILRFIAGRAGFDLLQVGTPSAELNAWKPAFTIQPGQSGKAAIQDLLAMVPEELFFADGRAHLIRPAPTDASTYSIGTAHAIDKGTYSQRSVIPNRVQVYGRGVLGEAFNWSEINTVYDSLLQIRDLNQTTSGNAATRAGNVLAAAARGFQIDQIRIPPHCGAQVWDCVRVTEPKAGLNAQKRRLLAIETKYARGAKPVYEQRLTLGSTD